MNEMKPIESCCTDLHFQAWVKGEDLAQAWGDHSVTEKPGQVVSTLRM